MSSLDTSTLSLATCLRSRLLPFFFHSIESCNIFQNKVVTLNNGKVAVFDDALNSFVCFCLWFALTHDVRHGWNGDVCQFVLPFVKFGGFTWCGNHSCLCSSRNSAVTNGILHNWLHDCVMALGQLLLLKLVS